MRFPDAGLQFFQLEFVVARAQGIARLSGVYRIGTEGDQTFYGHSFIASHRGELVAELGRTDTGVILADLDLEEIRRNRASFGFFRDRRPDLYGVITER